MDRNIVYFDGTPLGELKGDVVITKQPQQPPTSYVWVLVRSTKTDSPDELLRVTSDSVLFQRCATIPGIDAFGYHDTGRNLYLAYLVMTQMLAELQANLEELDEQDDN